MDFFIEFLENIMPSFSTWLLAPGIIIGIRMFKKYLNRYMLAILMKRGTTFCFLLSWIVFGFFGKLDYTLRWGCIVSTEPVFSFENILYSCISLCIICISLLIQIRRIAVFLLVGELIFWLYKLFCIKGGYVFGFGGIPRDDVLSYDFLALFLRLVFLKQTANLKLRGDFIVVGAFLIMVVKVAFFR